MCPLLWVPKIFRVHCYGYSILITWGALLLTIILESIFRNRKIEQERLINDKIGPGSKKRLEKLIELLSSDDFKINVEDKEQLDKLIERAKQEKELYDIWKPYKSIFSGMLKYVIIPIITIIISEALEGSKDPKELLKRTMVIVLIFFIGFMLLLCFALFNNELMYSDAHKLDRFINDLEDIKLFSQLVNCLNAEKTTNKTTVT